MKIIDKIEPRKNICRHCYGNVEKFEGLWGILFEQVKEILPKSSRQLHAFDHTSSNKYWFISQPYDALDDSGKLSEETEDLINYSLQCGVGCALIKEGYHFEGTTCLIFYPLYLPIFKDFINYGLDQHTRYDDSINIGAPHYMRFDKSYARRLIRNYNLPEESKIIKSAIDFLTWSDIK